MKRAGLFCMNRQALLIRAREIEKTFMSVQKMVLFNDNGVYLVNGQRLSEGEFQSWRNTLPEDIQLIILSTGDLNGVK